jgi:hypothetical protein
MERICKNCQLYDGPSSTCSVRLLIMGQVIRDIPVDPKDECLWEKEGLADHIHEIRFKVVDPMTGQPTKGNGKVVMEYTDEYLYGDRPELPEPNYNEEIKKLSEDT